MTLPDTKSALSDASHPITSATPSGDATRPSAMARTSSVIQPVDHHHVVEPLGRERGCVLGWREGVGQPSRWRC
jgi:hypothetical protein